MVRGVAAECEEAGAHVQDVSPDGKTGLLALIPTHHGVATEVVKVVGNVGGFLVSEGAGVDSRSADGDTSIQARHCREARDAFGRANPSELTLPLRAFRTSLRFRSQSTAFDPDARG
jgi:hypothetical protein